MGYPKVNQSQDKGNYKVNSPNYPSLQPQSKKVKEKQKLTDEELARRLQEEENGTFTTDDLDSDFALALQLELEMNEVQ